MLELTKKLREEIRDTPDNLLLKRFPLLTRELLRSVKDGTYKKPRRLVFDIETSQAEGKFFQLKTEYISPDRITKPSFIIGFAWRWEDERKAHSCFVTPQEAKTRNDKRIMLKMRELLDEADEVIGHHSDKFDIKTINTAFITHGIPYPSPYTSYDTKKIACTEGRFMSNKLDYLVRRLNNTAKLKTDISLWDGCEEGDKTQLSLMARYCRRDVDCDHSLWTLLKPYVRSNPRRWNVRMRDFI